VFLDTSYSGIGADFTTQITDVFDEELQLGVKFKPKFIHNTMVPSFAASIEVAPSLVFSFTQEHNAQGRSMLADVIANDNIHYLRIRCKGKDLSTAVDGSITELVQFDLAGKFTEPEEIKDVLSMGVYGYKYHFVALDDPTMARPWNVRIHNTLTAL
jgi:hypothetical protein